MYSQKSAIKSEVESSHSDHESKTLSQKNKYGATSESSEVNPNVSGEKMIEVQVVNESSSTSSEGSEIQIPVQDYQEPISNSHGEQVQEIIFKTRDIDVEILTERIQEELN